MTIKLRATLDDLYAIPENGKAELVDGELLIMSPTGSIPGRAAGKIYASLNRHEEEVGGGYAYPDNVGFVVNLPNRESFSPDAAWYVGEVDSMKFLQGAPRFAVEVRSEGDYGPAPDRAILQKIRDYFTAGTQVVWDVDLKGEAVITKYVADAPDYPVIFGRDEIAEAEPAVPGWRFEVNKLLR